MSITIYPPQSSKSWLEELAPPTPLIKNVNNNYGYGYIMPTPNNDGSYIKLPYSSSATLEKYTASGTLVWSVAPTSIGSGYQWTDVFWLDTADSAIWVWPKNNATHRLVKILLSNGAITTLGSCSFSSTTLFNILQHKYYYFERGAMGSGDFTIRYKQNKVVIRSSNGSIASGPTTVTQNGIALGAVGYQTADESIYSSGPVTTAGYSYIYIMRGGIYGHVYLPNFSPGSRTESYGGNAILWGGYVALVSQNAFDNPIRFFNRTDFDAWLKRIADFYGFPE